MRDSAAPKNAAPKNAAPNNSVARDHVVLYVNGERSEVRGEDAGLTLSDYLRSGRCGRRLVGTKVACAEGDCGACTVLVGRPLPGGSLVYETVDACIAFVYQMDRRHVVTVEGLDDAAVIERRLTTAQQAMVTHHGSQCGFCTPGFVMTLHGLLEASEGELDDAALRHGFSGNLCRCTGYASIVEAGRACTALPREPLSARYDGTAIAADFQKLGDAPVRVVRPQGDVLLPRTVEELLAFRAASPTARMVSGATDVGVQHNHGRVAPGPVIGLGGVEELRRTEVLGGELVVGAGATWAEVAEAVRERVPAYYDVLMRFGSPQVRNLGTLVGNLVNASPIADSIPFHLVAESTLEIASVRGVRKAPLGGFYKGYKQLDLAPDEVVTAVRTPLPSSDVEVRLYKVSKRRDMDISTVTAAFWIERRAGVVAAVRIAVGGVGPTVLRLPRAETLLRGKPLTLDAMTSAGRHAAEEVTPISDVRGSAAYRLELVRNLFVKCFHELTERLTAA